MQVTWASQHLLLGLSGIEHLLTDKQTKIFRIKELK